MLEESIVFRQLDASGRFSRFAYEDAIAPLLAYSVTYICGVLWAGVHQGYAYVALASTALATYWLRVRFPSGLFGLLHYLVAPKHLSALGADTLLAPYPAQPRPSHATRSQG
ncbi:hypothetical protein HUA74_43990 [Myxococcus sp. CA051A]|uniref:hypothetical protein n=1 Tax=Myxococcus sp. CA051A TaxID=2741739 RepID=UPI00157B004A|nr:hypothetical protein [Myxococcus sp. CA051A]NTX67631.1 hypothetical protein [Myxococcus sp. CA051A]